MGRKPRACLTNLEPRIQKAKAGTRSARGAPLPPELKGRARGASFFLI